MIGMERLRNLLQVLPARDDCPFLVEHLCWNSEGVGVERIRFLTQSTSRDRNSLVEFRKSFVELPSANYFRA
jgi:hypothetical protein